MFGDIVVTVPRPHADDFVFVPYFVVHVMGFQPCVAYSVRWCFFHSLCEYEPYGDICVRGCSGESLFDWS